MDPDGNPQSSDGATAMLYPQRGHKSLCTITRWFISLLEESEDGTLDLKDVSDLTPVNHAIQVLITTHELFYHIGVIITLLLVAMPGSYV